MAPSRSRRRAATAAVCALVTATLVPGLTQLPASAAASAAQQEAPEVTTLGDTVPGLADLDERGRALPTSAQRSAATGLGAVDLRWNQFGTPSSILPADGVLAPATSQEPVVAARNWLRQHAAVFGLTTDEVDDLELVNSQQLAQISARAVLFRQKFGNLESALGGMVTVGVANGEIAYVSSSIAKATENPAAAELTPVEG